MADDGEPTPIGQWQTAISCRAMLCGRLSVPEAGRFFFGFMDGPEASSKVNGPGMNECEDDGEGI